MHLSSGTYLQNSKYKILRVLGHGGFGITYLAENIYLGTKVAIKEFFPKDFCSRDNTSHLSLGTQNNAVTVLKLKERFLKEAKNIAKLNHHGIVKIHDIFEENDTAYYVMDYIEGENLNEMVKRNGALSESKAVEYIHKVGETLEYIHSNNMTHFDVKPANIVIRKSDDEPILIDFGLSKQYDIHGDATSTLMQGVSHGYSPIELYNAGSITSFSPQTDIYSLGATLYYLLTGSVPPSASQILENGIPIPTNISTSIKLAIKSVMAVSRTKRPDTVTTFIDKLITKKTSNKQPYRQILELEDTILINTQKGKTKVVNPVQQSINHSPISTSQIVIFLLILLMIICSKFTPEIMNFPNGYIFHGSYFDLYRFTRQNIIDDIVFISFIIPLFLCCIAIFRRQGILIIGWGIVLFLAMIWANSFCEPEGDITYHATHTMFIRLFAPIILGTIIMFLAFHIYDKSY